MFKNKYNPDVATNYNQYKNTWDKQKYKLNNEPYKLITSEKAPNIKTIEDLQIKFDNNKQLVYDKYNKLLSERKIKSIQLDKQKKKEIKDKLILKNTKLFDTEEDHIADFEDLKDDFKSDFKDKQDELRKDRDKFNSMLESLLDEGIFD